MLARLMTNVPGLLLQLMVKLHLRVPLPIKHSALFNSHQLVTSLAVKFHLNTNKLLLPLVFNNFSMRVVSTCSILAIQLHHTVHQTRCITNVITPLLFTPFQNTY
jgi:hypothetical protein